MKMIMEVNPVGLRSLQDQLLELGAELGVKTLTAAAKKAFQPVIDDAQRLAPVDTDALRESVKLRSKKPKSGETVVAVGLSIAGQSKRQRRLAKVRRRLHKKGLVSGSEKLPLAPKSRWHFEEFGTSKTRARPYIRPAFDKNVRWMIEDLKFELGKAILRAVKRKARQAAKKST